MQQMPFERSNNNVQYVKNNVFFFFYLEPHKHIALHQIHQIMFFSATSYDPFNLTLQLNSVISLTDIMLIYQPIEILKSVLYLCNTLFYALLIQCHKEHEVITYSHDQINISCQREKKLKKIIHKFQCFQSITCQVKSSHLYLDSAFNNTNCVKATWQYQNRKIVCQ